MEKIFIKIDGNLYGFSNNKKGYDKIDYAIWGCSLEEAIKKFIEHYSPNDEIQFEFVKIISQIKVYAGIFKNLLPIPQISG